MSQNNNVSISVEVVTGAKALRQFLALPHRIYASDPAWIAPLNFMKREQLSKANHFFEHARWRAWIAYRNGITVGRITAQIDEMHLQQHADAVGYFGMLEADDDPAIFSALFCAAEDWLRSEGMEQVRGPFGLHVNE